MSKTINNIVAEKLCVGCGICAAICPTKCIELIKSDGYLMPKIDTLRCISCGKCYNVCSAQDDQCYSHDNLCMKSETEAFSAWCRDDEIRMNATSGGVITGMIMALLRDNIYDDAMIVEWDDVNTVAETHRYSQSEDWRRTQKSKYLPVSQYNTAKIMVDNPTLRLIIVATPCHIITLKNFIQQNNLDENNYLFVGLFCDGTMNYNFVNYFQSSVCQQRELARLEFRSKESGGWPGDVKVVFADGNVAFYDRKERMKGKPFFSLERCSYCTLKLNMCADISVGDDYIAHEKDSKGRSNVLVNTVKGRNIWEKYKEELEWHEVSSEEILVSQKINKKEQNIYNWNKKKGKSERRDLRKFFNFYKNKLCRKIGGTGKNHFIRALILLKR